MPRGAACDAVSQPATPADSSAFKFCVYLYARRLEVIADTWDSKKFLEAPVEEWEDAHDGFSTDAIQKASKDLLFQARVDLVVELDLMIQTLTAWCERCPCHEPIQSKYREGAPMDIARKECGQWATSGIPCPMRGCRAPEVAAGEVMRQLQAESAATLSKLTLKWKFRLPVDAWASLVADYAKGKSHIAYILTLKLDNWQQLPWYLCILGRIDEETARQGGAKILNMYWPAFSPRSFTIEMR